MIKTAIFTLSILIALSANARSLAPGIQIAKSESSARSGNFEGSIYRVSNLENNTNTFYLDLDGNNYTYITGQGLCFGAVTRSGCTYEPSGQQGDLSVIVSSKSKCISENEEETLTTYTISTLTLYAYEKNSGCRFRVF
jgi:hypothetical protein